MQHSGLNHSQIGVLSGLIALEKIKLQDLQEKKGKLLKQGRQHLRELHHALKEIEQGKYGICKKCLGALSYKHLLSNPSQKLCQSCEKIFSD